MNNVVKLGLILAAIGIVISLLTRYAIDIEILFSFKFWLASIIINSIILIYLGRKFLRDPDEGRLGYGQAVKKLFLALLLSSVITISFGIILYGNDEEMKTAYEKYEIEMQESAVKMTAGLTGQSEAEQEAILEELREQRESGELQSGGYPFTWSKFPLSFFGGAIGNLIFSLLIALFIREKETGMA